MSNGFVINRYILVITSQILVRKIDLYFHRNILTIVQDFKISKIQVVVKPVLINFIVVKDPSIKNLKNVKISKNSTFLAMNFEANNGVYSNFIRQIFLDKKVDLNIENIKENLNIEVVIFSILWIKIGKQL